MTNPQHLRPTPAAGSLAFALLAALAGWYVATGRWGSYVGFPAHHIYIGDIVVAATLIVFAATGLRHAVQPRAWRGQSWVVFATTILVIWAVVRLVTSPRLDLVALRDFAPYGYGVVAVVVAASSRRGRGLSRHLPSAALVSHAIWVTAVQLVPTLPSRLVALGNTRLFELRSDFDSMICGVAAVFFARYVVVRGAWQRRVVSLLLAVWNAILAATMPSRAGLLAGVAFMAVALAAALWRAPSVHRRRTARRLAVPLAATAVFVAGMAAVLAFTTPGTRLLQSFQPKAQAGGTAQARTLVYDKVVKYVTAKPSRIAVGVGFGSDFLTQSGAAADLEGIFTGVRSPHDYELGTWARLGLPGLILTAAITLGGFWLAFTALRRRTASAWSSLSAGLLIGLPIIAALGVNLESPFGAIPYFFAIGYLGSCRATGSTTAEGSQRIAASLRESSSSKLPSLRHQSAS